MIQKGERPALLKKRLGGLLVPLLRAKMRFSVLSIEGKQWPAAAALLGSGSIPFVGQVVPKRREQEGTKAPALSLQTSERLPLDQSRKESLRNVLCIRRRVAAAPHERIERAPIVLIKPGKRLVCTGVSGHCCLQNDRPVGGREGHMLTINSKPSRSRQSFYRAPFRGQR